jgi:heptosyltransferase I
MVFMRIAIVKLSALGDIVHAMIVLQFIKEFKKEISIDWFVDEAYKDLLEYHPDIKKVHLVNLKQAKNKKSILTLIKEFKKIRKLSHYDLVIDMQGLIKSAIISKLIPSIKTLGFDRYSIRERFASFFYNETFNCPYDQNIILRNVELIEYAFGLKVDTKKIQNKDPFLFSINNKQSITISKTKKNILLIPGASNKSKCYPVSKLAEFSTLIDANFIILWGNSEERKLAEKIKFLSSKVMISEKLSINSLISLTNKVDLVIGPDTGPTHIAWALNVPSITLFGPTPGYRNILETSINKIIESKTSVNPFDIDYEDLSISEIETKEIAIMTSKLLNIPK